MKGIPVLHAQTTVQNLGNGTTRRVLSHSEQLMAVEVGFEKWAQGAPHTHPHTQCSYVLTGEFEYTVEDRSVILRPGDSIIVPGGAVHGTICREAGTLLDIFTPERKDFLPE